MQISKKAPKPFQHLKLIHNEHFSKLQQKSTSDIDLLEDMRGFLRQKSNMERDYLHALQKLTSTYLSRRETDMSATVSKESISSDTSSLRSSVGRQPWDVWKSYLKHEQTSTSHRLTALDNQQEMVHLLKPLKIQRSGASKRLLEQLRSLQVDLSVCLQEMLKSHKVYAEEEKQCHEARMKARAAEEKVRRRSTNLFHSMAQLQKNYDKLIARREDCVNRSTTARNEYLFQLAALNAALQHYYSLDLPEIAKAIDGEVHSKIREMLSLVVIQEFEAAKLVLQNTGQLETDTKLIHREYCWSEFLRVNGTYQDMVQYQFEPMIGDQITLLHPPNSKDGETLINVGRKLIKRLLAHQRRMRAYENEVKLLQGGGRVTPTLTTDAGVSLPPISHTTSMESNETAVNVDPTPTVSYNLEYVEHKVEELVHAIRREEIEKVKIEACLKLLTDSGVNVQDMLLEANRAAAAFEAEQLHYQQQMNLQQQSQRQNVWGPASTYGLGTSDSLGSASVYEGSDTLPYNTRSEFGLPPGPYGLSGTMLDDVCSLRRVPHNNHSASQQLPDIAASISGHRASLPAITQENIPDKRIGSTKNTHSVGSGSNLSINVPEVGSQTALSGQPDNCSTHTEESNFEIGSGDADSRPSQSQLRATAMFEYQATRSDELDLVVYETVNIIGLGDADGWLQVQSLLDGRVGFIPEAFVQLDHSERDAGRLAALKAGLPLNLDLTVGTSSTTSVPREGDGSNHGKKDGERASSGSSSPDYENWHDQYENWGPPPVAPPRTCRKATDDNHVPLIQSETAKSISSQRILNEMKKALPSEVTNVKLQTQRPQTIQTKQTLDLVSSIFPFVASNADELTFGANQIIRVLSRTTAPGGVDDGWWEGELVESSDGNVNLSLDKSCMKRGIFPSMLVRPVVSPSCTPLDNIPKVSTAICSQSFVTSPNIDRPGPPPFQPPSLPTNTMTENDKKSNEPLKTEKKLSSHDKAEEQPIVSNLAEEIVDNVLHGALDTAQPDTSSHLIRTESCELDDYVQISQDADYRIADL